MVGNASVCHPGSNNNNNGPPPQEAQQQPPPQQPQATLYQEVPDDLTCDICGELFQAAVTIKNCQHSFCSFCVRLDFAEQSKKLKRKVSCPCCRAELFERSLNQADKVLRVNLELQQKVFVFKQLKLQQKHQSQQQQQQQQEEEEDTSPRRRSTRRSSPPNQQQQQQQQQQSQVPHKRNLQLQKLNTVHYHGKKRNALVTLLKQYHLPTTGTEDELKNRHMRFVLYWNSLCDERVDPPSGPTIIQQFRSSELLKKEAAKRSHSMMSIGKSSSSLSSNNDTSAESSSTDEVEARVALLREHAKGFRELYEKILDQFAEKWCEANLSLSIAVLQSHTMIQNVNFRDYLRQRALNNNYKKIKMKDVLSGDVPLPEGIENHLVVPALAGFKGNMGNSSSQTTHDYTQASSQPNTQRLPSPITFEENLKRKLRESHESTARKRLKQSNSPLAATTSVKKHPALAQTSNAVAAPTSKPYSNIHLAAGSSVLNPDSRDLTLPLPRFKSPTQVTTSVSARPQQQDHYSRSTIAQPSNTTTMASGRGQVFSSYTSSATTPPCMSTASRATTLASNRPRNAVSPQTVATTTKSMPALFQNKRATRKKPSWHWTCKVCAYEMKMDPTAKSCGFCGSAKGATFDDIIHNNESSKTTTTTDGGENPATRQPSSGGGSLNDPIEMS